MTALPLLIAIALAAPAGEKAVALIPPVADDATWAASVEAALRRALEATSGLAVLDAGRTFDELAGARELGLDCAAGDDACWAKLAVLLRVDLLVVPVRAEGGELELIAYDAATGGRLNVVREALPPEGPARLSRVHTLVELLLVPERQLGRLVVHTAAGARVVLDGGASAEGPVARFDAVTAGPHRVLVELDEARAVRSVDVAAGELVTLDVPLAAAAPEVEGGAPSLLMAGLATGVVGVLALGVGGVGAAAVAAILEDPGRELSGDARLSTLRGGQALLAAAALGGALAVAGGALVGVALISE